MVVYFYFMIMRWECYCIHRHDCHPAFDAGSVKYNLQAFMRSRIKCGMTTSGRDFRYVKNAGLMVVHFIYIVY